MEASKKFFFFNGSAIKDEGGIPLTKKITFSAAASQTKISFSNSINSHICFYGDFIIGRFYI